jgi:hypothetical protein
VLCPALGPLVFPSSGCVSDAPCGCGCGCGWQEWAVGQVVEFFDKGSGGATDFCAAIGGIYVVKSITASDHVILDVYKGDASVAGNTDCQVTGTTNLITAGGEACEACPAGKEPGTTFLTVGSCVDCDPGKFSSATSVCYECMTGASWRTLQGVGVTLAAAEYGWCETIHARSTS